MCRPVPGEYYREKILRLPNGYLCYEPPPYAPPVGPLPALAAGHVTFGCFNNTAKITPAVIAVWAAILRRLSSARLLLKYHWLDDAGLRERLANQFAAEGIAAKRLELLGSTTHAEQLGAVQPHRPGARHVSVFGRPDHAARPAGWACRW